VKKLFIVEIRRFLIYYKVCAHARINSNINFEPCQLPQTEVMNK